MDIDNLTLKVLDDEYVVVKNNSKKTYIKLGYSETKYLLFKLNVPIDALENDMLKVYYSDDLSDESKVFLDNKFKEWGFYRKSIQAPEKNKVGFKELSKIQLFKINPEKFLDRIPEKIGLIYSIPGIFLLFVFSLLKYSLLYFVPESCASELLEYYISMQDVIIIFLMITVTLMLHEISHALACRHYGGKVTSMGMVLYFFTPCFFCDVSDIYLSSSKKNSFCVGVGGLVANLLVGNFSFILYCLLAYIFNINLHILILFWFSNLGVIIFNLLPFVKLDGYWILSAVTGITNLMDKSVLAFFFAVRLRLGLLSSIKMSKKLFLIIFGCIVVIFRPIFWCYSVWGIYEFLMNLGVNSYICVGVLVFLFTFVLFDQIRFFVTQIKKCENEGERLLRQIR